ncbi:MAG: 23S rRNA pseudouridine(2605) synthase RluB [Alcanivorax sp.]|uniref:Pseudouridine synthase n=1 Tax=Alloalcanivorax marinus TaxID=1177169 RepID=A0A9Q3UQA3_9GAMM|nr:pseudouridine synthase [Alloalcanivorax marinus]MBM7334439.1 pseudouridine synthase [Alloalcanivorax marinus]MCC4309544.1 pseudouridine synthase [Alloalcanivorax marinus]MCH2557539.1 pseudouridine synthase [Alcanivorax sp.]MCU5787494.1 S4 domain-containing protein [Alloalcanivorax marinus]
MSEKLQKVLARTGLGSRRELETWIANGRISVNGKVATLGDRVEPEDTIRVDGRIIPVKAEEDVIRRVIVYHKPAGEVCSRNDPQGRPTVFDNLPRLQGLRWVQVGRLDINTTGLMLFTTDGELAHRLMHPSNGFVREYAVRVRGELTDEKRRAMLDGVLLEDGVSRFDSIEDAGGGEEAANHWHKVSLTGGKYREVRRLFQSQDLEVARLIRIRFGDLTLPSDLRMGRWKELTADEIKPLTDRVDLKGKKYTGLYGRARLRHQRGDKPPRKPRRNPYRR